MRVTLAEVRQALQNDELEPCFQPVIEIRTGRLVGFEILARWRHPRLGLVLPANFINLAEENGLIGKLMRQILRQALASAPLIPAPLTLAVNVSPTQLHDPSLPDQIRSIAEEAGFSLKRIVVEITESGLVSNLELARQIAGELKSIGCRLALDDFGTGYSSLVHLQALPFDILKVDRSFVATINGKRESRKIIAAIVGLGHSLGLNTVAEGIETEKQANMLLQLGCERGQGWFYGQPAPADQLPGIVAAPPRTVSPAPIIAGNISVATSLEAQPAQRLAQLQAIYDGAPVGLCFLDRNLRYVSLNLRLAALNGSPVEAHLGRTVNEMIPEFFTAVEPFLLRALKGEALHEIEVTKPPSSRGGPGRTILLSYQPAFDEGGEVIGVSVAVVDITERKRVEEALRESEDHLRYMVELNPEIPWVLDAQGNNIDVSSRWTELTGLTKQQTRGMGWLAALHPDDVEHTKRVLAEGLLYKKKIDVEYRVKSLDRGYIWMRSRGAPRLGPAGEIIRWYGSVEDIDSRRQMEASLLPRELRA